jgi:hypothetical protein
MSAYSIEVQKTNLAKTRNIPMVPAEDVKLEAGQALLQVDKFALTANNITYGVAGDMIGYWQFFPAAEGWGRIPVWGMATVTSSNVDGIEAGQRYYGYFPMSSYLVVEPARISERGFVDGVSHRAALPPTYNQYSRVTVENGYPPEFDDHQMIYRPLFTTAFVLDDFLADNSFFTAKTIILSSASSKTAFGLAYLLKQRPGISVIGLTSKGNREFVSNLGLYDQVATYDEVEQLDRDQAVVFVDMAGNRQVLERLHEHFQDNMKYSCGVGITHWESRDGKAPATLPGAKPAMFFAPSQIQKRHKDWGPEKFQTELARAWELFLTDVDKWVDVVPRSGATELLNTYQEVLNGAAPNQAFVVAL